MRHRVPLRQRRNAAVVNVTVGCLSALASASAKLESPKTLSLYPSCTRMRLLVRSARPRATPASRFQRMTAPS